MRPDSRQIGLKLGYDPHQISIPTKYPQNEFLNGKDEASKIIESFSFGYFISSVVY
jgi:hypothetical protein